MKNSKGITLIALVITIIVMLILVTVTITMAVNGGLFTYAGRAKGDTQNEINAEQELANLESNMTTEQLIAKYTTSQAGGKVALSTITASNYGDYIDLGQSVVGDSESTSDDWRIIYNDTTNNVVYAILSDYLPTDNAAVTASGLNKSGTYVVYSNTSEDDLLSKLNSTTAWQTLIPETLRSSVQVKGAVTAEILMASYNAKYNTNLNYTDFPYLRTNPNDSSSSIDTLYMPRPTAYFSGYNGCYGYWLASPSNAVGWCVECRGFMSYGYDDYDLGVCPVVSLPSNVQVTSSTTNGVTVWSLVN